MRFFPSLAVLGLLVTFSATSLADGPKKPLALQPDDGFENEVHKKFAGKMVFAKAADVLALGSEAPAKFTTTFAISEPIYWRAYAERSPANAFRAEGTECNNYSHSQRAFQRMYYADIDGVTAPYPFSMRTLEDEEFQRWATWRDKKPLNGADEPEVASTGKDFMNEVVAKLTPGTHKIRFRVGAKCELGDVNLATPMAVGEITVTVAPGEVDRLLAKNGPKLPAAKRKDPKLAQEALAIAKKQYEPDAGGTVLKVVLTEADWSVERNELTGIIVSRSILTRVAERKKDKTCQLFSMRVAQDAQKGSKFGPTHYSSTGFDTETIPCVNVK